MIKPDFYSQHSDVGRYKTVPLIQLIRRFIGLLCEVLLTNVHSKLLTCFQWKVSKYINLNKMENKII